jgi:hypothetical protein
MNSGKQRNGLNLGLTLVFPFIVNPSFFETKFENVLEHESGT